MVGSAGEAIRLWWGRRRSCTSHRFTDAWSVRADDVRTDRDLSRATVHPVTANYENFIGPPDLLDLIDRYTPAHGSGVAQLVGFEYQFAALVWLRATVHRAVETETAALRKLEESGRHRVAGYETESDDVLRESILLLEMDAAAISSGAVIATCCGALESLLTELLPPPPSQRQAPRGLVPKARALAAMWPNLAAAEALVDHVKWLADRRNSFAHRLLDESGPCEQDPNAPSYTFDNDAVEEAFERVGVITSILNMGYDGYLLRRDGGEHSS